MMLAKPGGNRMAFLEGKVAVVTGSTRGFGLALVQAFVREGAAVVVSSRSAGAVEKVVDALRLQGIRISGQTCDVTDLAQVEALAVHAVRAFGGFDVWVNNAGNEAPYGPTVHQVPERFTQVTQTNILGAYYGSLVAMRHFLAHGRGKLINILGRGERGPLPMQNAYGASKAWLKNFTLALAKEYQTSGVGIYTFSPGMMDTDMLLDVEVVAGFEDRLKIFGKVVQTLSQPPEIPARKAVWLASSASDGKTGLLVRELNPLKMLALSLRLLGRTRQPLPVKIRSVPAAYPENDDQTA